jgi:signal transduction histidine kinase
MKASPDISVDRIETVAASLCSWWRPVRRQADSGPGRPAAQVNYAVLLGGVATVLYAAVVLNSQVNPAVRVAVDDVGSALAALVASVLALRAGWAQRTRRARTSWLLIALSLLWWGVGDLYWAWFEVVTGTPAVTPSLADVAYLVAAPLIFAGILLRPTLRRRAISRWLLLIDACLALAALFAISWVIIIGTVYAQHDVDPLVQVVTLAYPILDLAMLFCLLLAMLRASGHRPATGLLLFGLAAAAVADSGYAGLVAASAYETGHPIDMLWFVALVLIGLAAVVERDDTAGSVSLPAATVGAPWRFVAPTLLVVIASVVVWTVSLRRGEGSGGPAEIALGIAWLLLMGRVYLGYRTAVAAHLHERRLRIGHASSFRHEQQRRRQLEAVRDIAAELTRELDLTGLLTLITRRAAGLLDAPIGSALLWDEPERVLVPRAWHGVGPWLGDLRIRSGEGAAGRAAERRRGVVVNEYLTSREAYPQILAHVALSAVVAVPVISLGRLVGVITVADQRPGRAFDEHDLSLLGLLADQAAVAIEHAHLFEQAASAEALRELARLKTEFLTTASHELRTPLTLIHGYAELLRFRADTLTTARVVEMADEILTGSRTMIRLVDDLLDFSRLESTRPVLERQRLDVVDLLDREIRVWSGQPGGHRLVLEADAPVEAEVDPARLDQVIRHLLSNALEHTPAGPVVVRATSERGVPGKLGWIRVEVVDEGSGIPEEEQPRVWEPFFRGQRALNSPHRGSGLGLAVVKQLVELHGGHVDLESGANRGSTFRVWLPAADQPAPTRAAS